MSYRLLVGCPTYGKPSAEFAMDSYGALMYHIGRRHPEIEEVFSVRDVRTYRQTARQAIVEQALHLNCSHLLMLDDDHVFEGATFTKLWNAMHQHPKRPKVLSALYYTRSNSCAPCIFRQTLQGTVPIFYYPDDDDVHEVDVVGFGFVIFDTSVFDPARGGLNPPWFNLGNDFGEDAAFCARMNHSGNPVHVHVGAKIGHILENPQIVGEREYLRVREALNHARELRQQAGEPLEDTSLRPIFEASSGNAREYAGDSGYVPVDAGGRSRWWTPSPHRIWKRDSLLSGIARKEGVGEGAS